MCLSPAGLRNPAERERWPGHDSLKIATQLFQTILQLSRVKGQARMPEGGPLRARAVQSLKGLRFRMRWNFGPKNET